jgi:hypothetical protein
MIYFWLFIAYLFIRLLFRSAFHEQGMKVSHVVKIMLEGFVYTAGAIILFALIANA